MLGQTVLSRKKRGPPATGKGTLIGVRLQPDSLQLVDNWAAKQDDQPSRPEAIRRLIEMALTGHSSKISRIVALNASDAKAAPKAQESHIDV
jgi:hypothetical protein